MKRLTIKNLSFSFNPKTAELFRHVNAQFTAGQLNFVCGKNGSGKSTLFRIIQGHIHTGEVVDGTITLDDKEAYTHEVRMVQQDSKSMTAAHSSFEHNVQMAALPEYPGLRQLPPANMLSELTQQFGIDPTIPAHLLSGGQRQILAIVMALQKPTQLLLLDEPTAALDEYNAALVMNFLQLITKKLGIITIIICHDKELVARYTQDGYYEFKQDNSGIKTLAYTYKSL